MTTFSFWAVFAAIVAIASALTGAVSGWFKIEKSWVKVLLSWIFSIGLAFAAWGLKFLPAIGTPEWAFVLLHGFCAGLVSNRFYDIDWVKRLYKVIFGEDYPEYVTLEETPSANGSRLTNVMKFQNELADYIKVEDDKITLTVKKEK